MAIGIHSESQISAKTDDRYIFIFMAIFLFLHVYHIIGLSMITESLSTLPY